MKETVPFAATVGIDWADEKHDVSLLARGSATATHFTIDQKPEALTAWVTELRARFGGRPVAIAVEQRGGPLIHFLLQHEFLVLYPVNPAQLAQYRKAFAPSGAKDDPSDSALLLEMLTQHRDRLRAWRPDDVKTRKLALLVEARRKTVNDRTRLSNRLRAVLKGYFPQALELVGTDVFRPLACDFLLAWPRLEALKRAETHEIRAFYYGHNVRRTESVDSRLQLIAEAVPLTTDAAIVEASILAVKTLARQLRVLNEAIEEYDREIARVFKTHPDAPIFDSLPRAGAVLAPRLLVAFGTQRDRYDSAADIQIYSGVAPVVERSGKKEWIHWRWFCPKFLRQSFHEFAKESIKESTWARAYCKLQREKGKSHNTAVRALAFKWIRIIFRCWKDRVPYDESAYLEALRRRGSPLYRYILDSDAEESN